jgi:hypothetical protein
LKEGNLYFQGLVQLLADELKEKGNSLVLCVVEEWWSQSEVTLAAGDVEQTVGEELVLPEPESEFPDLFIVESGLELVLSALAECVADHEVVAEYKFSPPAGHLAA